MSLLNEDNVRPLYFRQLLDELFNNVANIFSSSVPLTELVH